MTDNGYTNNTGRRLRDLAASWHEIATNEAVDAGTRHGYRECANQLLASAAELDS